MGGWRMGLEPWGSIGLWCCVWLIDCLVCGVGGMLHVGVGLCAVLVRPGPGRVGVWRVPRESARGSRALGCGWARLQLGAARASMRRRCPDRPARRGGRGERRGVTRAP
eukprot:scaffold202079_cov37-Tisochrysis_lutea.AAC.4